MVELLGEKGTEWRQKQTFMKTEGEAPRAACSLLLPWWTCWVPWPSEPSSGCWPALQGRGTHMSRTPGFSDRARQKVSSLQGFFFFFFNIIIILIALFFLNAHWLQWVEKTPSLREVGDIVWKWETDHWLFRLPNFTFFRGRSLDSPRVLIVAPPLMRSCLHAGVGGYTRNYSVNSASSPRGSESLLVTLPTVLFRRQSRESQPELLKFLKGTH